MNKNIKQRVQEVFKHYPQQSQVFITADGTFFFNKQDAQAHANILEDKEVVTEVKAEAEAEVKAEAEVEAEAEDKAKAPAGGKRETK